MREAIDRLRDDDAGAIVRHHSIVRFHFSSRRRKNHDFDVTPTSR